MTPDSTPPPDAVEAMDNLLRNTPWLTPQPAHDHGAAGFCTDHAQDGPDERTETVAEAVEAGARALFRADYPRSPKGWDEIHEGLRGTFRRLATAVLSVVGYADLLDCPRHADGHRGVVTDTFDVAHNPSAEAPDATRLEIEVEPTSAFVIGQHVQVEVSR